MYCAVPEKIDTHPKEGHQKFQAGKGGGGGGGGGVLKAKILEEKYETKLEFTRGREVQNKKPSVGGVWIFPVTAHYGSVIFRHDQPILLYLLFCSSLMMLSEVCLG